MSENIADIELIREICEGSHTAFATLVRRYSKYFYAIAYRYTAQRQTAEDITQQAFLKLWQCPDKYDPKRGASFKTWFTQVIIHLCIDYKRKNRHFFEDIEELQVESNDKGASDKVYESQVHKALEAAIHKLPINQQTALNLGFYQNIAYDDVAKIMKTSTSAVKSLIMRAKENLKKHLGGKGYDEEI